MRRTRYLVLLLAIYFAFIGGSSRYVTLYQVRVLHHIVVTVVLGLWLFRQIRKNKGIPSTPLNVPLFALIGTWFISALTSLDPRMAIEHVWFPLTFIILFFVVVDYFQRRRGKIIMETFFFIVLIVIFLTGLELASWYFGLGLLPGTSVGWADVGILIPPFFPKVSMAMGISTLVAGFTVPAIFITATWALTVRYRTHRRVLWIIALMLVATLILTFSRGGLLAFIGGLAVFIIIRAIQHPALTSRVSPKIVGGIGGMIALALMIGFVGLTLPYAIGRSDKGRLDMWQSAVSITVDHPITGVGPGLFGRAYREYRDPLMARDKLASAHNFYLNTASELGVLGIIVGTWLAFTLIKASWKTWQSAKGRNQHLRVEGMVAALAALAIHSSVDVFTITPINFILIIIVAYLVTGQRSILDPLPEGQTRVAYVFLAIIVAFGGVLLNWDRAQGLFQSSFSAPYEEALALTRDAQSIDPYLNLYHLHEAFLIGRNANSPEEIDTAIATYENVLRLEPTWDIGWMNLASLALQQNDVDSALNHLQTAHEIFPSNSALFAYAHIADEYDALDDESIVTAYQRANSYDTNIPLAEVWWRTPRAAEATKIYTAMFPLELQYRVYRIYQPDKLPDLVPSNPKTAGDWWIIGQEALANDNLNEADAAFTNAIELNPTRGDYYVARARTRLEQQDAAQHDINLARLYGTTYEYPNLVLASFAETEAEADRIRASAIPSNPSTQEFAGVLYTRPAVFDAPRNMRFPGLGESIIQPWYDIAESYVEAGDIESAILAYNFILENAPYDSYAQDRLDQLVENRDS